MSSALFSDTVMSLLQAQMYSAKKNGPVTPSVSQDQDQNRSEEAILALRQALHEVQDLDRKEKSLRNGGQQSPEGGDHRGLPMIAQLLQVLIRFVI